MPWVRIDENAMDHPKFLAISDGAWRLWCEGQAYCQKHLTDGRIERAALKGFRYYSPSRLKLLTASSIQDKAPLWHHGDDGSVTVHDYLDWNDSRAHVLSSREESRERKRRWLDKQNAEKNTVLPPSFGTRSSTNSSLRGVECIGSGSLGKEDDEPFSSLEPPGKCDDPAIRAGEFIDRYKAMHVRLRRGAHYLGKPHMDFQEALQLVGVFDDATLDKLAYVWLNTDHPFAESGTRTLAKFRSMASWCQERVNDWESSKGPLVVNA